MEIKTAIEGRKACENLRIEIVKMPYNPDLAKMLKNIDALITDVSKKEVVCRQTHSRNVLIEPLKKLNKCLDHLEKMVLMAKLML